MTDHLRHLAIEIELQPGEKLALPPAVIDSVGAGRWVVTIEPAGAAPIRGHGALLNGYVAEDEGLYDADSGR
ncbi:MAG: hypothetical protein EXR98_20460 [Gemmataceae bacterium]|nr:hypothetical protein [Gemmataceae bacterium]